MTTSSQTADTCTQSNLILYYCYEYHKIQVTTVIHMYALIANKSFSEEFLIIQRMALSINTLGNSTE